VRSIPDSDCTFECTLNQEPVKEVLCRERLNDYRLSGACKERRRARDVPSRDGDNDVERDAMSESVSAELSDVTSRAAVDRYNVSSEN